MDKDSIKVMVHDSLLQLQKEETVITDDNITGILESFNYLWAEDFIKCEVPPGYPTGRIKVVAVLHVSSVFFCFKNTVSGSHASLSYPLDKLNEI